MLELNGHPGLFLHDDGRTKPASIEALTRAIALCEKWNAELIANKQKKIDRAAKKML